MIGKLSGKAIYKENKSVIIDISGIGYKVFLTEEDLSKIKEDGEISLWTHLIVREDVLDLYGFIDIETKSFFELLINISGIGPKTALGILSIAPTKILRKAIITQNTSYLTKVSGIGKKSAEKIVMELRDKLSKIDADNLELHEDEDALLALKSLGYNTKDIREALKILPDNVIGTQERIKELLKILSK